MFKRFFVVFSSMIICVAFVSAQESKLIVPAPPTSANNGKQMYESYCATCHGLDGRGHGPGANVLQVQPTDLSRLSKNNNGTYPDTHVIAVIRFGMESPAHGSKSMPVWGPALLKMDPPSGGLYNIQALRIANLANYVETLQAK